MVMIILFVFEMLPYTCYHLWHNKLQKDHFIIGLNLQAENSRPEILSVVFNYRAGLQASASLGEDPPPRLCTLLLTAANMNF